MRQNWLQTISNQVCYLETISSHEKSEQIVARARAPRTTQILGRAKEAQSCYFHLHVVRSTGRYFSGPDKIL